MPRVFQKSRRIMGSDVNGSGGGSALSPIKILWMAIALVAMVVVLFSMLSTNHDVLVTSDTLQGLVAIAAAAGGNSNNGGAGASSGTSSSRGAAAAADNNNNDLNQEEIDVVANAHQIRTWRQSIRERCALAKTKTEVDAIGSINKNLFVMPSSLQQQSQQQQRRRDPSTTPESYYKSQATKTRRCKQVVFDFGANIGDTSTHLMGAGLIGCDRMKDLKTKLDDPWFNIATRKIENVESAYRKRRNPLVGQFVKLLESQNAGPENYCYYGIEGNPVFTPRLQEFEQFVMNIRPRPLQHLHFFTESVGAGKDGMTQLYLDTINPEHNYWGSSLFKNHQDIRKGANETNNKSTGSTTTTADADGTKFVTADVMGITIGRLLRETAIAYKPGATEEEKKGGHFILKVDIEGGEFPLIHEAVTEGTLCEWIKMGNQADLYVEYHSQRVTGKHELWQFRKSDKEALIACGANWRNLQSWWW